MAKIATQTQRKTSPAARQSQDEQQEVQNLAYQFFVERGCEHGHDVEDWTRAEKIVRSRRKN